MAIVLENVRSQPLDNCFTYGCRNKPRFILVVISKIGFSLMCGVCRDNYQNRYTLADVTVEPYTRERAEELDQLVIEDESKRGH